MIGNINADQFRKHPTGGRGLVNILRILFMLGCIFGTGVVIISIYKMFNSDISLYVIAKKAVLPDVIGEGFSVSNVKQMGLLNFKIRNAAEWLFMPRSNRFDLYTNIFSLLITWQLFKISNEINMEKPFYGEVVKRLRFLQQLIILGWIVVGLQYTYVYSVIREISNKTYGLGSLVQAVSPGYLSLGTWLIVLLFSHVYKKGLHLQRDQDLTI